MGKIIKFIFKLIFRFALALASAAGVLLALNKFSPDTMDALNGWLKEQRHV